MLEILNAIYNKLKQTHKVEVYQDLYDMCRETMKTDIPLAVKFLRLLSAECENAIRSGEGDLHKVFALHKRVLLLAAPYDFDSYLLYIEWAREPEKKFYPPRRKILKQVVDCLQELVDDELDLLAISLPPGSGKTMVVITIKSRQCGSSSIVLRRRVLYGHRRRNLTVLRPGCQLLRGSRVVLTMISLPWSVRLFFRVRQITPMKHLTAP